MAKRTRTSRNRKNTPRKAAASGRRPLPYLLGVLALTVLAFIPVFSAEFVNWDDPENLLKNPYTAALTWDNVVSIFHPERGRVLGNYNPLPILTFAVERSIFGLNPTVFHTTNVLLHLLTVFLVFRTGQRLKLPFWGALLLAALFAVHPMRVESVAWVTERKDVLFAALYFGAILQWLRYRRTGRNAARFALLALFVLALFAKIQAVALPLSLLAIDYWQRRPLRFGLLLEKWDLFALSLAFGLFGIVALGEAGSLENAADYTVVERLLVGAYSYLVYLVKAIVPYEMAPLYPYPQQLSLPFYLAPLGVLALFVGLWLAHRRGARAVVFGVAFFTVNVMFLLQVLGAGQGFLADRFTYVPYFGLFFGVGFYFARLLKRFPGRKFPLLGGAAAVLLLYAGWSFRQTRIWQNGRTLWSHELAHYPDIHTPYQNLGHWYRDRRQYEPAYDYYSQAIRVNPARAEIYNSRGKLQFDHGNIAAAIADYDRGIERDATIAELFINRGAAHGSTGDMRRALDDFTRGLELDPDFVNGYRNRSIAYAQLGQPEAAIGDLRKTLEFQPNDAASWSDLAATLNQLGRYAEALPAAERAVALRPDLEPAQRALARARRGLEQQ